MSFSKYWLPDSKHFNEISLFCVAYISSYVTEVIGTSQMMPSAYLLLWETSYCSFLMYSKCIFHPPVCCPAYENILKSSKFFPVLCSLWIKLLFYWSNATFSIISVEFSGEGRNTYTKSMCTLKYLIFLMVVHIFYVGKMTQHIRNGSLGLQLWSCVYGCATLWQKILNFCPFVNYLRKLS